MRYEACGWGLIGLCGGAAISLWLARPLDDPNWWRTSIAISLVGTVAGAGLLAWPGLVTAWQFLRNAKFHYRLRSPIERLMAWPRFPPFLRRR
jgi:hypothetical protein